LDTSFDSTRGKACIDVLVGISPPFNILFVIDNSGSTTETYGGANSYFPGTPIGDINNDGEENRILDAEIDSIIKAIEAIVSTPSLANDDVDIGIVTFSTSASYRGHWSPADPNDPTTINPDLKNTLTSIQSEVYTNFDDALDKAIIYFEGSDNSLGGAPDVNSRTNIMYFLSDGVPNQCGDDDPNTAETNNCNMNDDNTPGSTVFTSELNTLSQWSVAIHAIGVGPKSEVGPTSALAVIDNTENPRTGETVTQVITTDALTQLILESPVFSDVLDFELKVNGIVVQGVDESSLMSSPTGYIFGTTVSGLNSSNGASNSITATVLLDVDGQESTTNDQLQLGLSTIVSA
jgi:hypothetical protein